MRHSTPAPRLALAVAAGLTLGAAQPARAQSPADELSHRVDAVFAEYDKPDSPGCALGVIRDGALVLARGYGRANLEHDVPITPQTIFDIGSTSKQFSAASVILLQQQGRLSLADDVRKYVPELRDYGTPITIRHLLNHTSGLRDYLTLFALAGIDFDGVTDDADALRVIGRQQALNFAPGQEHLYSNSGYFLLSIIVERVSGQSLPAFAGARIFEPLGMTRTHVHDDHTMIVPGRATGYAPRDGGGFRIAMSGFEQTGDGAVFTSVEDLVRWDRNFYEPRVGGEPMLRELLARGPLNDGTLLDYASGLVHSTYRGLPVVSHGGSWAGYRAELLRLPSERFSVACLCNLAGTDPSALARRVVDVYLSDRLAPRPSSPGNPTPAAAPVTPETARLRAGLFRNPQTGALRRVTSQDAGLRMDSLGPSSAALSAVDADHYQVTGASVSTTVGFRWTQGVRRPTLVLTREGSAPETFLPIEAASPSPADLAAFAGRYHSPELGVDYVVAMEGDRLLVSVGERKPQALHPTYRDAFAAEGLLFEFRRSGAGVVTSFTVQAGRVRNIAFDRVP